MKPALWDFAPERVRNKEFWKRPVASFVLWEGEGRTVWAAPGGLTVPQGASRPVWGSGDDSMRLEFSQAGNYAMTTPSALRLTFPFTLLFCLQSIGTSDVAQPFFGATYSDPGSSPWWGYGVERAVSGQPNTYLRALCNNGGILVFPFENIPGFEAGPTPDHFGIVFASGANLLVKNGSLLSISGLTYPGGPIYHPSSLFQIGSSSGQTSIGLYYAHIFDEALTVNEIAEIQADPYAPFTPERFPVEQIQGEAGPPPSFNPAMAEYTVFHEGRAI